MVVRLSVLCALLLLAAGCTDTNTSIDAATRDGAVDAAQGTDAGSTLDATQANDATTSANDATTSTDGSAVDTGVSSDTAVPLDASTSLTRCSVFATSGSSNSVTVRAETNGSGCTATIDDGAAVSIPCDTASSTLISPTVGLHVVRLFVAAGPGGPASCSVRYTAAPALLDAAVLPPGPTSCDVMVEPGAGGPGTDFSLTFSSNGSSCELDVGGFSLGSVPCRGGYVAKGSSLAFGELTVTLRVTMAAQGPATCTDTFTVTP